ncbi:hypothetical protein DRN69_02625, partial [Candidatus Pacearchaeota archaeon]
YSTANLYLQTNGVTRMTILNSNGNVGIGTTNPSAKLDVAGGIKVNKILLKQYECSSSGGCKQVSSGLYKVHNSYGCRCEYSGHIQLACDTGSRIALCWGP